MTSPGVYDGLTFEEYRAIPACNFSALKWCEWSMEHYQHNTENPPEETPDALRFGKAAHAHILEGVMPVVAPAINRRTNEGRAQWAEFEANYPAYIFEREWGELQAMRKRLLAHERAAKLVGAAGIAERVIVWTDADTGLLCKGRIDRHIPGVVALDYKTTTDARPLTWERTFGRYMYHAQCAFYGDGIAAVTGTKDPFVIIAQEKQAPHAVALYAPTADALVSGRVTYKRWLGMVKAARETGVFAGYPQEVQRLDIPSWMHEAQGEDIF